VTSWEEEEEDDNEEEDEERARSVACCLIPEVLLGYCRSTLSPSRCSDAGDRFETIYMIVQPPPGQPDQKSSLTRV